MIAHIAGAVLSVEGDRLIVDVHGVGYLVAVPHRVAETTAPGGPIALWVHTAVREDDIALYGFPSPAERTTFDLLIGVSGIGPKIALSLLSALDVPALARAIESNDVRALSSVSGVGKKTAERLVLELRGKLAWSPADFPVTARALAPSDPLPLALAQLGYKKSEIDLAVARLADAGLADAPLSERVGAALRLFSTQPRPG